VGAVLILIGHDHDLSVAQALEVVHGLVLLLVGEAHDLHQVVDLLVLHDLLVCRLPHVQQFTLQLSTFRNFFILSEKPTSLDME